MKTLHTNQADGQQNYHVMLDEGESLWMKKMHTSQADRQQNHHIMLDEGSYRG